jgi:tetratricopeptide (TPR) repeat protein
VKGIESFECAAIINNIGLVYRNKGKLNYAIEQYAKALSIYEGLKGMESLECAATLNNIGLVHQNQGKLD